MKELCRTNDVVMLSFLEFRLKENKIQHLILDANMSIMEGSVGILPRRVLVDDEQMPKARQVLQEAQNV